MLRTSHYSTNKLIRDVGLPVKKIYVCKNDCILYWKDNIDLHYCKFCGEAKYKPTRERNPNRKKTLYVIPRHLLLTSHLQRLYASEATTKHITWHANHQMEERSMFHLSDAEALRHFDQTYPEFALSRHILNFDHVSSV
ncbi:UNVERIFIED_CONTAM: hypothetical protein Sangu_1313600 [Sesamum angustifolium]|uniref:Transposase n=1 Tax=Sesamum angustifolium TaxID=2727405 RepID=A0AAW2NMM6_9LAMI